MHTCSNCGVEKPLSDFPKDKTRKKGIRGTCKNCHNARQNKKYRDIHGTRRKYLIENREDRLKMYRDIKYRKNFGLSLEEVTKMHEERDYKCAICEEKFDWLCVDHDHETGEVRNLLCSNCNSGIGMLKDSAELVRKAFEYLTKYKSEVKTYVD